MITGVVLAAGSATRFGSTKQIAVVRGKPLAQHAIDALTGAGIDQVLVVTGHDADAVEAALRLPPQGVFVRNAAFRDGQATSLAAAMHEVDESSEAAVILLGDQPGVTDAEVSELIDAFRRSRSRIVRLRYTDGPGPALLSREIYAEAGHLRGDVGARVLIASHPEWVTEVEVPFAAPPDVDVPDDLARDATGPPR